MAFYFLVFAWFFGKLTIVPLPLPPIVLPDKPFWEFFQKDGQRRRWSCTLFDVSTSVSSDWLDHPSQIFLPIFLEVEFEIFLCQFVTSSEVYGQFQAWKILHNSFRLN